MQGWYVVGHPCILFSCNHDWGSLCMGCQPRSTSMTFKTLFESQTCSRCGGTGHYSYCQMHGTTCFKCGGKGVTLTKRGSAAQAWFTAQKMRPASEIKVGDKIVVDGMPGCRGSVVTVDFVGYSDSVKYKGADGEWKQSFSVAGITANGGRHGISGFETTPIKLHIVGEELDALKA